jgi:hypothetical protein
MNTKAKLRDYLRRARSDASLRSSLLGNARFLKKVFGWITVVWAFLLLAQIASEGRPWFSSSSATAWLGVVFAVMSYDKFSDRVAMMESMEEQPNQPSAPTPTG